MGVDDRPTGDVARAMEETNRTLAKATVDLESLCTKAALVIRDWAKENPGATPSQALWAHRDIILLTLRSNLDLLHEACRVLDRP